MKIVIQASYEQDELLDRAVEYAMEDDFGDPGSSRNDEISDIKVNLSSTNQIADVNKVIDSLKQFLMDRLRNNLRNNHYLSFDVEEYENGKSSIFYGPSIKEVSLSNDGQILVTMWSGTRNNRDYYELDIDSGKFRKMTRNTFLKYYKDRNTIWGDRWHDE